MSKLLDMIDNNCNMHRRTESCYFEFSLLILCLMLSFTYSCSLYCKDCIYPNKGVGEIYIGMPSDGLLKKWPSYSKVAEFSAQKLFVYPDMGAIVLVSDKSTVKSITLYAAGRHKVPFIKSKIEFRSFTGKIDGKIGVDSKKIDVEKFFGGAPVNEKEEFNYKYEGIYFEYKQDGSIEYIKIYRQSDS